MKDYITVGHSNYAYSMSGEGELLVLLHGFTGTKETWAPFLSTLTKRFQVVTIDLPGHGKTKTAVPVTIEQFVHDLDHIVTSFGRENFHLLGYSLGGRIALTYAFHYPDRLYNLVLESASPGLKLHKEREERKLADANLVEKILTEGVRAFVDHWEQIPLFQSQKRLPKSIQQAVREERLSQSAEGLAQSLTYMGTGVQPSWWDHLHQLKVPTTLIVGHLDEKFVRINQAIMSQLKKGTLKIIPQAGHAVHLEQREKFVKIVLEQMNT